MRLKAAEVLKCVDCGDHFTEMAWSQQCWDAVRLLKTWLGLSGVHAISQQLSAVEDQLPGVFRLKAMVANLGRVAAEGAAASAGRGAKALEAPLHFREACSAACGTAVQGENRVQGRAVKGRAVARGMTSPCSAVRSSVGSSCAPATAGQGSHPFGRAALRGRTCRVGCEGVAADEKGRGKRGAEECQAQAQQAAGRGASRCFIHRRVH